MALPQRRVIGQGSVGNFVATMLLAGCAGDAIVCNLPCPLPEVGAITVTASNTPAGIAGVSVTVGGVTRGCPQGIDGAAVCHIYGNLGTYHVVLSAPGYQSASVDFTATDAAPSTCGCGQVDTQRRSVALQPTL